MTDREKSIEAAYEFIESYHEKNYSPVERDSWDVASEWLADFAAERVAEAVKAERERIVDVIRKFHNELRRDAQPTYRAEGLPEDVSPIYADEQPTARTMRRIWHVPGCPTDKAIRAGEKQDAGS